MGLCETAGCLGVSAGSPYMTLLWPTQTRAPSTWPCPARPPVSVLFETPPPFSAAALFARDLCTPILAGPHPLLCAQPHSLSPHGYGGQKLRDPSRFTAVSPEPRTVPGA